MDLLYPNLCVICNESLVRGEELICFQCLHQMPKTNYHLEKDNAVEKRFWGKVPVYRATSYFHFYKGSPFRQLLHELKYRGNKEIGRVMGRFAGVDLLDTDDFASVDVIVPVPLHPKKQLKRGYNQSEWIARGLSEALNKPVDATHLTRIKENATQTKKSVFERYQNTQGIFALNDVTVFEKKHVLLVDDVLTTGSTLEACALALMESSFVKVSVFTLALA